jgi:hypothetical protein
MEMDSITFAEKQPLHRRLYIQVIIGIVLGVALGHFAPDIGANMKPLGDGFIKLIKMLLAPVIFATIVVGIARMGDLKEVGKVGAKALLYFEVLSTIALVVGMIVVNVLKPGTGMNVDLELISVEHPSGSLRVKPVPLGQQLIASGLKPFPRTVKRCSPRADPPAGRAVCSRATGQPFRQPPPLSPPCPPSALADTSPQRSNAASSATRASTHRSPCGVASFFQNGACVLR